MVFSQGLPAPHQYGQGSAARVCLLPRQVAPPSTAAGSPGLEQAGVSLTSLSDLFSL